MSQIAHFLKGVNDKRYLSDFEEISKIGSGGFSSVFKVKNKLDDNFYAVKKIQLRIKDIKNDVNSELERVLREAKFLAKVFHPNVIRYYNSWIELKFDEKPGLSLTNDLFSEEINKNFSNFSEENQRNAKKSKELSADERQQQRKKHKESNNEQSEFVLEIESSNNNLEIAFENQENSVKEGKNKTSSSNFCDVDFDSNSNSNIDFDRSNEQENRGKENSKINAKNVSFANLKEKEKNGNLGHLQILSKNVKFFICFLYSRVMHIVYNSSNSVFVIILINLSKNLLY